MLQRVHEPTTPEPRDARFPANQSVSASQCVAVYCSALTSLLLKSQETRGSDRTSVTIYRAHLRKVQSSRRCGAVCCSALQRVAVTIQQDLRSRADEPNMTSHIFKKNLAFEPNIV